MNNKNNLATVIVMFAIVILVFIAGAVYGFKKGYENQYLFDAAGKASITTNELKRLHKGDIEGVIKSKEEDLDHHISAHGEYLKNGNPAMVYLYLRAFHPFPEGSTPKNFMAFNNNIMRYVANYRKQYPILWSVNYVCGENSNCPDEIKINAEKKREMIETTLKKYGWRP